MTKPNILFIVTDQQRKDTISAYAASQCETPVLDALSQQSTVFDNAYCTCPICTPARGSMQTGLYPMHTGMIINSYNVGNMVQEMPDTPELLSRRLLDAGYNAAYTGKWHLGNGAESVKNDPYMQENFGDVHFAELELGHDSVPTAVGYIGDDFPGHGFGGYYYPQYLKYLKGNGLEVKIENKISGHYDNHQGGEITSGLDSTVEAFLVNRTEALIDELEEKGNPWYMQLNFWGPHEPYFAPTEFLDKYRDMKLEPWKNFKGDIGDKPRIHDVKRGQIDKWEDVEPFVKHYFACASHTDYQIGRLIDYLKEKDLYDNTIIIFSADHGESLGIHGGLCDKAIFMYEETVSIPLMVKQANQQKQERIGQFVNTCDIYSTILDYAGVSSALAARDGKSFKPLLEKQTVEWPDTVVTECSGINSILFSQRMIRKENVKYVFNCGDVDELYDLDKDPYEKENLVSHPDYAKVLRSMQFELLHWMEDKKDYLRFEYKMLRMRDLLTK